MDMDGSCGAPLAIVSDGQALQSVIMVLIMVLLCWCC
jgi:hypothetical protein